MTPPTTDEAAQGACEKPTLGEQPQASKSLPYVGPDVQLIPIRDLPPLCEHCGKMYGNCKHHPLEANFKRVTLAELKELYADDKVNGLLKWDSEVIAKVTDLAKKGSDDDTE